MTSLSGVTGTRDQSLESSQSDWSTKFCKLLWRIADKHRQIFAGSKNFPTIKPITTVGSDLNQIKKASKLVYQLCVDEGNGTP